MTNFVPESFEIFDLLKYGLRYNNMEEWTKIRRVQWHDENLFLLFDFDRLPINIKQSHN